MPQRNKHCAIGCATQAEFLLHLEWDWSRCIMKPPSALLAAAVSHLLWVCTPAGQEVVDRFASSALAQVHPTIALRRTPRCPRTFGRRLLPLRHWLCSVRRRKPKRLCGTPCHTARRSGSWALPSLCRATPSATSERSGVDRLIANPSVFVASCIS